MKTKDLKEFGTGKCFVHYINEFNTLAETGIIFNINQKKRRVKFLLGLILGDNLGINSYFDLNALSAKNCCRFCKLSSDETKYYGKEDPNTLRTIENYNSDLENSESKLSGIKQESSLNKIKHFHVTKNKHVDVMHDWLEGILHYCMCFIILEFIACKCFNLSLLNNRIKTFSYGPIEIGNRPNPSISDVHLKKSSLKMTSRQVWCFTSYFGLMIGDLVHDKNNAYWNFYCKILDLMDLLLGSEFDDNTLDQMTELINEFNTTYISLFNDTLKPKHHNLTHYPTIIRYSGPPRYYSSMRFEAKHQDSKKYCNAITSRKNILLSLAIKSQLSFAYYLKFTPKIQNIVHLAKHKIKTNYNSLINTTSFQSFKLVKYLGTEYKISSNLSAIDHQGIHFLYEIKEIAVSANNVFIVAERMGELAYNELNRCYEVLKIPKTIALMDIKCFSSLPVNLHKMQFKMFVKLKSYFHNMQLSA